MASSMRARISSPLSTGDTLQSTSLAWGQGTLKLKLSAGPEVSLPPGQVVSIDLTLGKIQYLGQLPLRSKKNVRSIGEGSEDWFLGIDRHPYKTELIQLEAVQYRRGLAIRPQTSLQYRLGGEFRKFRALAGMDADLTVLAAYPAADIKAFAAVRYVLRSGRIIHQRN